MTAWYNEIDPFKPGKLGRIRLKGEALAALRRECFTRDGWCCVLCGAPVSWASGHMMHRKSRGAGGSDVIDNVDTGCGNCHQKSHNCGGQPLPRRPA